MEPKATGKKPSTKKRRPTVRAIEFVRAWKAWPTIGEICTLTGMDESAVRSRAVAYRKLGVNLPAREGESSGKFDVEALNALLG